MSESRHQHHLAAIPPAPPLPAPEGPVVRVDTAIDIIRAIEDAEEGQTILIAPGRYAMPRDCLLSTHRVTIRGESGNRDDVVLDGGAEFDDELPRLRTRGAGGALIKIRHARGVTIADLTVANSPKYGIHFFGCGRVQDLLVHNVVFHNIWARGLKGTSAERVDDAWTKHLDGERLERLEWVRPRRGTVRHCLFVADHPKRNLEDGFDGDYIAGLDLMNVADWTITDNLFVGIQGRNGGGRGAVFIWHRADRVTVERNRFIDCDRAVSLGNPSGYETSEYHIHDAVVRANRIDGGCGIGIEIDHGDHVQIVDNTIDSGPDRLHPAIRIRHVGDDVAVTGNRIRHVGEGIRCPDQVRCSDNRVDAIAAQV